jgi:hypothetical protein
MPRLLSLELKKTCHRLLGRIQDRFPTAGLLHTCENLLRISEDSENTLKWIKRPNYAIKFLAWLLISILIFSLERSWVSLGVSFSGLNAADFFQMVDAGFNSAILFGASGIYLMTSEGRWKRKKVINAVNKLRCIAHIIDAHQLLKDPSCIAEKETFCSPNRNLNDYDLGRYLDYCSEMLSLTSKIAFLYVQDFDDPIANESVNDLENLTIGISQKVWQKIVILKQKDCGLLLKQNSSV